MENFIEAASVEVRSTDVQEIISQVPSGIVRWGMAALLGVMLGLVGICWFVQYPDVLHATVVVTTTDPPYTFVSRASGHLVLLKKENEPIKMGELFAYIRTSVNPSTVALLERQVKESTLFSVTDFAETLGEFESDYGQLRSSALNVQLLKENASFQNQIRQLQKQKSTYLRLQRTLQRQEKLARQELLLAREKYKMDSLLYSQQVLATLEFNKENGAWIQQQRSYGNVESSLINNELQIDQLSKQISDLEIQEIEEGQKLDAIFNNSKKVLQAHIDKWKESYLYIAPMEGKVAYIGLLDTEMFVDVLRPVFSILPMKESLIARAELPLHNSGKVKEGQKVNIRLENYPYEQFGIVNGIVSAISLVPNEKKYQVSISLPNGLQTNQNRILPFKQQLSGTTEIITEELRLVERFFYQFRKLITASPS